MKAHIGLIGLGTMGASLARNAARNKAVVSIYNRTIEKTDEFMNEYENEGEFVATRSYEQFVQSIPTPRIIILMVQAGDAVDAVVADMLPYLDKGDIVIDAGNSFYKDTARRFQALETKNIHFVGLGVSGGEVGALEGPSMMFGGSEYSWKICAPLLTAMAADDKNKGKCIAYLGQGGAGHFVKMIHNGIEYGLMQLIAESYALLKQVGDYSNEELADVYSTWNHSHILQSYLMEITSKIFTKEDTDSNEDIIDVIADRAKQKGTGKWTTQIALDYGASIPTITTAVDARILSGAEKLRNYFADFEPGTINDAHKPTKSKIASQMRNALQLTFLLTYFQGFESIQQISQEEDFELPLFEIARIWQGGCIIRSETLVLFENYYSKFKKTATAAQDEFLHTFTSHRIKDWRHILETSISFGVPMPCFATTLNYYDSLHTARLPQSLIQAQRDFFGAHTFERIDKKGSFHIDW